MSIAFLLAVIFGALLGLLMRRIMGARVRLGWAEAALSGIFGAVAGSTLSSLLAGGFARAQWGSLLLLSALSTVLVMLVVGYFSREPQRDAAALIAAGESAEVEFKSTARCNLHTGQRDDKIELVVAKTVSAFANSKGGDLLIGVDDDGNALGLANDLKFMKAPDLDRFELWLRDYLTQTLGATTTAGVQVAFPKIDGQAICHVHVQPSTHPAFLRPAKGQPVQMWVRVGNSTRQLGLDDALSYAADRWGRRRLR